MSDPNKRTAGWLGSKFRSSETELLEREGATAQGVQIIDELNRVYERTGVFGKVAGLVMGEVEALPKPPSASFRLLEIGCRDGALLGRIAERSQQSGLNVELHGLEFRQNLVQLAQERATSAAGSPHIHFGATPQLAELEDQSFDLVYSLFSLHHFEQREVEALLLASRRLARHACLHVDLQRSGWGAAMIWTAYTVMGCRRARGDSVLSVRRAYRMQEIQALAKSLGLDATVRPLRRPPLYWLLRSATVAGSVD